ncbi:MAG: hypothetical protein Q9164_006923 [Protoblastenia rupestris]
MSHLQYTSYEGYGQRVKKDLHYSQAVRIGDTIECSGQGGWDRITEEIPHEIGKQIDQAFANVEHTVQKAGGKGWEQVYNVRAYCVPLNNEALDHILRNFRKYCPNHQPLYTVVGVQRLGFDDMRVEIEVKAHVGS